MWDKFLFLSGAGAAPRPIWVGIADAEGLYRYQSRYGSEGYMIRGLNTAENDDDGVGFDG